jgi:DNA-binding response OmpR family regulator
MKILLVEDDNYLAQTVAAALTKQHYLVDIAVDGEAGSELATAWNYDLILLDVMLPKLDGISLCRQLRQQGYQMPILLLTAKDTRTDKVMGLDAGADDYLVKPFEFEELTARIRALLRRGNSCLPPILEWESLRLDPSSCEVSYASQPLHLTAKEFSVLELFLRNKERVFSRGAIIEQLWDLEDPPEEDTIKSYIKSLRRKLKAAGAPDDFIETVYGIGYRLKPLEEEAASQIAEKESNKAQQAIFLAAVAKVREEFKNNLGSRIAVIKQASNALKEGTLDSKLCCKAEQEAHKLVGSLGSFGFTHSSQIAEEIEDIFSRKPFYNAEQSLRLGEQVIKLERQLKETSNETICVEPVSKEQHHRLLIVSEDGQIINEVVEEAIKRKIEVETATNTQQARNIFSWFNPDVVLLDLDFNHSDEESLKLLAKLSKGTSPVPILVLTNRDNFNFRIEVARAGGHVFLPKSMLPSEMLQHVTQVLKSIDANEAKIMVVDDDPQVLAVIQNLLEPRGFKLETLANPSKFWDIITEFCPDLLILDIEMPDVNGIELCQVVRQEPCWSKLPVVLVSDRINAHTVDQIFAAGADDCISKPIEAAKLIQRIWARLERIKLVTKMGHAEA